MKIQKLINVRKRLKQQLIRGTKSMKSGNGSAKNAFVEFKGELPLTEKDIARIRREINTLETKSYNKKLVNYATGTN